jgi:serine protease Do
VTACAAAGATLGSALTWFWCESTREAHPVPREVESNVDLLPSLAPLVDSVRTGVVGVRTIHRLEDPVEDGGTRWEPEVSRGTGFVIHPDGLVLTARHVVADPAMIAVELAEGLRREAELVGEDPSTDLAVIRVVDPPGQLRALEFGRSEAVRQGDWVLSIGNPLSFRQSVAIGIVAYAGRHLVQDGMGVTNDYLQVSAPMHPGSSGSPIFDLEGRVLGITTRTANTAEDLSFAVSARMIRRVLDSMDRNQGRARRAFLGIQFTSVDPVTRERFGLVEGQGVLVTRVESGRPAELAGLRTGDVIVSFEGRDVSSVHELHDWITWSQPDREVTVRVVREPESVAELRVRPAELPT